MLIAVVALVGVLAAVIVLATRDQGSSGCGGNQSCGAPATPVAALSFAVNGTPLLRQNRDLRTAATRNADVPVARGSIVRMRLTIAPPAHVVVHDVYIGLTNRPGTVDAPGLPVAKPRTTTVYLAHLPSVDATRTIDLNWTATSIAGYRRVYVSMSYAVPGAGSGADLVTLLVSK